MVYPLVFILPSIRILFMDNSSYSFHQVVLKLGGQLDHELVWRILFRGYSTPNFDRIIMLKQFFRIDFF